LAGALNLSRTDALFNLQANGTERTSQGITRTDNADGSRTYLVDLSGIAADTAVNLSFDLIGFGGNGSQVTINDARLLLREEELVSNIATVNITVTPVNVPV